MSAPLDPSTLHISERRRGDTRNSCFDLNMATVQALQAKADKAMGKDLSPKEENEHETESDSEDEYHNEYSDNCKENANENDISTHPSAIQQNKCFQITRDRGQTRFAEPVHLLSHLLSVR